MIVAAICWLVFGGPIPFTAPPFVLKAVFTTQTELTSRLAGADRRRRRRQGDRASAHRRRLAPPPLVTMDDRLRTACRSTPTRPSQIRPRLFLEGNFYIDLQPGTPSAPPLQLRRHAARRAQQRAGAARPRAVVAELRRARQPADAAAGARTARSTRRRRGAGRHPGPERARADRRPGAEPVAGLLGRRVQGVGDRQPGAARGPSRTTSRASSPATRRCSRRWRPTSRAAREPGDDVQRDDGGAGRAPAGALGQTIALLPALLRDTKAALGPLQALVRADAASSPPRSCPGVKQPGPTIAAGLPWLAQANALVSPQRARRAADAT